MSTTTGEFQPIRAASLVDEAHRQIRAQIIAGRLKPGEPLKDSVLAEQMGISRSPVREALRLLEQSGLVEKSANKSYRISVLAADDVPELAALRAADEVIAVRTIVRNRVPVDRLDAAIDRLRRAEGDVVATAAADAAFHADVVALAGLPRLSARYSGLIDQIRLVLLASEVEGWGTHDRMTENHLVLLEALRDAVHSGDAREVVRIWEDHVLSGMTVPGILGPL
ncbi:MAG: GntR family transcriptional regulator [Pseudolysinimonas sp.]